ncbi:MAG: NADH-quinone oxidoreductase subunit M [Bacteroidota bacterium]
MLDQNLLSLIIFSPLLGVAILFFIKNENKSLQKIIAIANTILTFALSLYLYFKFDSTKSDYQFMQDLEWISGFDIHYILGVDGLSLVLILLTTFLTLISIIGTSNSIKEKLKGFLQFVLLLEVGMLGVFLSLDLVLFYVFWEAMLIPMYFLIGIWGGEERIYATVKFFLYTMFGSLLMLVAIIYLGYIASTIPQGAFTTNLIKLNSIAPTLSKDLQLILFLAFTFSFAIKIPLFPFHTWLPDAHVQAPTAGSVLLAGVLLKMGTYGLLRFSIPFFPIAAIEMAPIISTIAVIGIIYGALVAMVQTDIKKLVAYSSVSHMGFIVLGIFSFSIEGTQGAILQMLNHGLSTGALFLLVGMIYDRRHTKLISEFGGLAKIMPIFSTLFLIITFSSIGVPGLNGFVGEFLILLGAFKSTILSRGFSIVSALGVVLSAIYMLWMYQRVFFGVVSKDENRNLKDLNKTEIFVLSLILIFVLWIGIYPSTFLKLTEISSAKILTVLFDTSKYLSIL